MVSIAGGEPMIHPEIDQIVRELVSRKKFVYLCSKGLLMRKKMGSGSRRTPSRAPPAPPLRLASWIASTTSSKTMYTTQAKYGLGSNKSAPGVPDEHRYLNDEVRVDGMMSHRGFAYELAPDQEHFLGPDDARALFRAAFADGRRKNWRLNHSPLFLDFLEGKVDYGCTAWGIPCYSIFGWQRPCYLMSDGDYAPTYRELVETTDWDRYGRGRHPKCENSMAHCGYESPVVMDTMGSLKAIDQSPRAPLTVRKRKRRVKSPLPRTWPQTAPYPKSRWMRRPPTGSRGKPLRAEPRPRQGVEALWSRPPSRYPLPSVPGDSRGPRDPESLSTRDTRSGMRRVER